MEMRRVRGLQLSRVLFLLFFFSLSAGEQTQEAFYSLHASVRANDVNIPDFNSARADAFHLRGHAENIQPLGASSESHKEVTWSSILLNDVDTMAGRKYAQVHYMLSFRSALFENSSLIRTT